LPQDLIQHAILPFLDLKDVVRLDSAIVKTSKRQVLDNCLDGWKLTSRVKLSSDLAPLQWIVNRNIRLVHLYLDESITFEALDLLLIAGRDMQTVRWKESRTHLVTKIVDEYVNSIQASSKQSNSNLKFNKDVLSTSKWMMIYEMDKLLILTKLTTTMLTRRINILERHCLYI
jgi:hypothetical protein